jgi:hypothetical protein
MTSARQIDANRRNALLSTGPVTEGGKRRSRRNALRHGLTAETVIDALEDAEDYAAFEIAVAADYHAESAVERELVLRLASLFWRLRRANAIESGLLRVQGPQLQQFRQQRRDQSRQNVIKGTCRNAGAPEDGGQQSEQGSNDGLERVLQSNEGPADQFEDLTRSFIRLCNLPSYPLDRLSRHEAALWRQACQILFTLRYLDRSKPWGRPKFR